MNSTGLIAKVLSKRTEELISPRERTLALRQGFQPLPDYRFYVFVDTNGQYRVLYHSGALAKDRPHKQPHQLTLHWDSKQDEQASFLTANPSGLCA